MGSFLRECHCLSLSAGLELCGTWVCINSVKNIPHPKELLSGWKIRYRQMGKHQVGLK